MHTDRLDFYKGMLDKARVTSKPMNQRLSETPVWGKVWFTTDECVRSFLVEPKEATTTVAVEASDMDGHEAATSLLLSKS